MWFIKEPQFSKNPLPSGRNTKDYWDKKNFKIIITQSLSYFKSKFSKIIKLISMIFFSSQQTLAFWQGGKGVFENCGSKNHNTHCNFSTREPGLVVINFFFFSNSAQFIWIFNMRYDSNHPIVAKFLKKYWKIEINLIFKTLIKFFFKN